MQKVTHTHPIVSCGKTKKEILRYVSTLDKSDVYNNCEMERRLKYKISRQAIYNHLKKLKQIGYITYNEDGQKYYHTTKITKLGIAYLGGVTSHRIVCNPEQQQKQVRTHKFCFQIPITKFPKSWKQNMCQIISNNYIQMNLQNFSKNNPILRLDYDFEVHVAITTTCVQIRPKNIMNQDNVEASAEALTRTMNVITDLQKLGFELKDTKGRLHLIQTEGHYANINSLLAQWFEKYMKGFYVKDNKGETIFWVDHSNKHLEEETKTEEARENIDAAMRFLCRKGSELPDIFDRLVLVEKISIENTKSIFGLRTLLIENNKPQTNNYINFSDPIPGVG